ncbi:MAG: ATP-binding protein [Persicimonas sp.]
MTQGSSSNEGELKEALDALREECRQKDQFIATLAHELRNPITALRAAVHLQQMGSQDEVLREKTFEIIERQTEHMERLIDDLMDASRLSRGKVSLDLEPIDISTVVAQAVLDHKKSFEDEGVDLCLELETSSAWVEGDRTRLSQVLGNLLDNALKATEEGDEVTVCVDSDEDGNEAVILVEDTGEGIAGEEVEHLFERFAQTDQWAHHGGGLGLGLAIVGGLIGLHDGEIEVQSEGEGRGSTFEVRLPLVEPPEESLSHETSSEAATTQRIVIIENERDVGHLLAQLLEMDGHDVSLALDADQGLSRVKEKRPDTILCELQLDGEVDGFGLGRAVRVDPRYESVRLVAMTGSSDEAMRERSLSIGFDEHLVKPLDLDDLRRVLHPDPSYVSNTTTPTD